MRPERPRAVRYPFAATVELTNLESSHKTSERTSDLSVFGCHVASGEALPKGTRVRLRVTHKGEVFNATGQVANVRLTSGVGIVFTKVEERDQLVLEKWITEPRDNRRPAQGFL